MAQHHRTRVLMEVNSRTSLNAIFRLAGLKALTIRLRGGTKIELHTLVCGEWRGIITQFPVCSFTFTRAIVLTNT